MIVVRDILEGLEANLTPDLVHCFMSFKKMRRCSALYGVIEYGVPSYPDMQAEYPVITY